MLQFESNKLQASRFKLQERCRFLIKNLQLEAIAVR